MEEIFIRALSQIKADEELKIKTAEYILNANSKVTSVNAPSHAIRKPIYVKRLVAAACAAVILCTLSVGGYAYYKTPTSYVSVDINPSVELGINAFFKVVTVKAYNTDGETVIAGLSLYNRNVESAVRQIVKSAAQNGYITDDGTTFISVTAETNNEQKAEILEQAAQTGAEDAIESENDTATVETDNIALDRRDEAIALGITPGKLNLIQKLQALDPTIETADYKEASVTEIQKKFAELKKENNGKNDKDDVAVAPSPGTSTDPGASPSAPPSPSPAAPATPDKPGNGNNNSNGNKKDDETDVSPSPTAGSDTSGSSPNGHNGSNGNAGHDKDKENNDNENG
jgi:hypothetical protein